jgi:outer membrane receptor protein involved in Fe transport
VPKGCLLVLALSFVLLGASASDAQVFGTVRVIARDQQNLTLPGAEVLVKAMASDWSQSGATNTTGEAVFPTVPVGQYTVTVSLMGFKTGTRDILVGSNAVTPVPFTLAVAGLEQTVEVSVALQAVNPESSKTETLIGREDILREPDEDRSGSLAMITNNVPGAFVMHDHLHSRGGHGVTWEIDGVPVPNSNLASVGSQFDPKDVASLEVNRGGLSTNLGDRSYGVFNVVPRSGFEGKRFGDVAASYGSYHESNLYLSLGNHTDDQRFAYFGSVSANRTDRGLERVDIPVLNDQAANGSAFTSLMYNISPFDQLRFVGSARLDHYSVPNTVEQQALGIRDREVATDGLTNFTWAHTSTAGTLLTVSPYYHYNRGRYIGGPNDPLITSDDRSSHYMGGAVNLSMTKGQHTFRFGTDSFAEHDDSLFGLQSTTGTKLSLVQDERLWASVVSAYVEDTYRATSWLTLNNGLRWERFQGTLTEYGTSPRLGAAISIPHLGVLRASYSHYYQHPQTSTISGPILGFALQEGFDFLPVPGERDHVGEIGLGIPIHGWTLDFDGYYNSTHNAVDHEVLGNSNLLFPLTIQEGRVRAFESTLQSPMIRGRLRVHYAFAYSIAQGKGNITGGLTNFKPPPNQYFYLDHDQRVTFNSGADLNLPWNAWISGAVLYGSGFLRGDGPDHMPQHTTLDLSVGRNFTKELSLRFSALNVTNEQYLTGFENSFAGTHWANPRVVSVQVRYKFNY